jgi:competence protein ComEA
MKSAYGVRSVIRAPKRLKLFFIAAALIGIAAVTYLDRGATDEAAGDVLYAGQAGAGDVLAGQAGGSDEPAGAAVNSGEEGASAGMTDGREQGAVLPAEGGGAGAVGGGDASVMSAAAASGPGVLFVDVCGAVRSPAVYELTPGSRVYEALEAAGGLTEDADIRYLNRATALADGDRIYVPTKEEVEAEGPLPGSAGLVDGTSGAAPGTAGAASVAGAASAAAQVNINTADSAALQTLNGVGPATAQKIMDYRDQHGPFAKIEDIRNVSGIGEKTFEKLKDHICV